jgi:hypothetical protein
MLSHPCFQHSSVAKYLVLCFLVCSQDVHQICPRRQEGNTAVKKPFRYVTLVEFCLHSKWLLIWSILLWCKLQNPSLSLEFLGSYLAELSLLDYGLLRFLPSLVAASVVFVARLTLDPHTHPWVWHRSALFQFLLWLIFYGMLTHFAMYIWLQSKKMQALTGYNPSELKDCVTAIHGLQLNRKCSSMMAIRDKYKQHRVSMNFWQPHGFHVRPFA